MVETLTTEIRVARKDHFDDSRYFIEDAMQNIWDELTGQEQTFMTELGDRGWRILKGHSYSYSRNKMDRTLYDYKTYEICDSICRKFKLWRE